MGFIDDVAVLSFIIKQIKVDLDNLWLGKLDKQMRVYIVNINRN